MASVTDFPARGRIIAMQDKAIVFSAADTNYEVRLDLAGGLEGARVGMMAEALIRVSSRKVWTVPSGGNFIAPIFGPPRIVQGRIKYLEEHFMVVQAGFPVIVELPHDPSAYDLVRGGLAVGALVNVSILPGGTIEMLPKESDIQAVGAAGR